MASDTVPTLNLTEISGFHSRTISWLPVVTDAKHHDYHINRLSDIVDKSNFKVLPHRKTLHDFIFLKSGKSKRSKGLNKFEFGASTMFFLPAYQITQHQMMSEDADGFFLPL
jgi:hypothetical protein